MSQPHETSIKIYAGVPWDDSYTDVRYFEGSVSIPGTLLYSGTNFSYQRVTSYISQPRIAYSARVPKNANELYSANYLEFNNGTKTFYCFVKEVNYVNLNCTEIIYIIDVFTTWFYDCTLNPSYVVREHATTDEPGDNTVYENFGGLDYIEKETNTWFPQNTTIAVYTTSNKPNTYNAVTGTWDYQPPEPGAIIGGVYQALHVETFTDAPSANEYIKKWVTTGKEAGLVQVTTNKVAGASDTMSITIPTTLTAVGGNSAQYNPKNKKLLTFQFNRCVLCSSTGECKELAYEFISEPVVDINAMPSNEMTAIAVPHYLTGVKNYNYAVTTTLAIQSPYLTDNYDAYWGAIRQETKLTSAVNIGANAVNGFLLGGTGGALISAGSSAINSAANILQQDIQSNRLTADYHAGITGDINFRTGRVGFYVVQKNISTNLAKQIDKYFSAYGYATNTVKQPNLTGRTYFNYVQLKQPSLSGSIPAYATEIIKNILSRGVRLWHNNNIGAWNPEGGNPIG